MEESEEGFVTPEEEFRNTKGGRPREHQSQAEKQAAYRERKKAEAEQADRDEEYIRAELEITRQRYADDPQLATRLKQSEAYLRKWVAGEIGPRSIRKETTT